MRKTWVTLPVAGLLAGLAGCGGIPDAPEAPAPEAGSSGFVEGRFTASQAAADACKALLESQSALAVTVVGSQASETTSLVFMRVGEAGAPWRCLVDDDGGFPSLMFMGDEGAL